MNQPQAVEARQPGGTALRHETGSSEAVLLVVDPDTAVREALKEAFRVAGFTVEAGADAPAAMRVLATRGASIALVDVGPAGSHGWTVVRLLREAGLERIATMGVMRGMVRLSELAGAIGHWEKPLPVDEVAVWLWRSMGSGRAGKVPDAG